MWIKQVSVNASQCSENPSLAFSFSPLTATFFAFITLCLLFSCFTLLSLLAQFLSLSFGILEPYIFASHSYSLLSLCVVFRILCSYSIKVSTRLLSIPCFAMHKASAQALSLSLCSHEHFSMVHLCILGLF